MEEVTAGVYLVSISRSRYSAVYGGGHAKTALLHAAISAAAHQICEMLTNVQFRFCHDERSELSWIFLTKLLSAFDSPSRAVCVHTALYELCFTVSLNNIVKLKLYIYKIYI